MRILLLRASREARPRGIQYLTPKSFAAGGCSGKNIVRWTWISGPEKTLKEDQ